MKGAAGNSDFRNLESSLRLRPQFYGQLAMVAVVFLIAVSCTGSQGNQPIGGTSEINALQRDADFLREDVSQLRAGSRGIAQSLGELEREYLSLY